MKTSKKAYFPELDSLRAFAVLFVLFHHYFNQEIAQKMLLGNIGVDIFFVLSGFLITGILLTYKDNLPLKKALKQFYFRRALRIFPLYFFYLFLVFLLFTATFSKPLLLASGFYLLNFYMIYVEPLPGLLFHLWSLSVEEQFYLLWPFFILFSPRRFIKTLILLCIVCSILFSLANTFIFDVLYVEYMHLGSCVQALGMGGLLAVMEKENPQHVDLFKKYNASFLFVSAALLAAAIIFYDRHMYLFTFIRTMGSWLGFFMIIRLTTEEFKTTFFHKIMRVRWLQFIGRISYGIYIYHMVVKALLGSVFDRLLPYSWSYWITTPFYTIVTVFVAWASFRMIEQPVKNLKNYTSLYPGSVLPHRK